MDQNSPSSSNQSPAVDTLLNDILSGSPVSDSTMPAVSSSSVSSDTTSVSNHMHDMLEPSPSASSSRLPLGDSEPGVPSSSRPAASTMPTVPMASPISAQPVAPLSPVSPVSVAGPQTVSHAGGQSFQTAQAPKAGMPKATIAAVIAVIAVVLGGVGAGVVLSGENQDVRNQAYVAPKQQQIDKNNPPETLSGSTMSFVMTPKNAFIVAKDKYPNAATQQLSGSGVSGTLYSADSAEGKKIVFGELTGITNPTPTSVPTAWLVFDDGTYYAFSSLENTASEDGTKAYFSFESVSDSKVAGFVVSYENPETQIVGGAATVPVEKVIDVRL